MRMVQSGAALEPILIISIEHVETDDKNLFIFLEYHNAAFAGQQLYNVSESFAYYVPCPEKQNPFRFELETSELKRLAAALAFIITRYSR